MSKALIIDPDPSGHGSNVKSYFDHDSPSDWTSDIYSSSHSSAVDKAIDEDYKIIIRSQTNLWTSKDEWSRAWDNGILTVHSHGSNSLTELDEPPYIPEFIVPVGGENPDDSDEETSYGLGLEMDAKAYDGSTEQSYATPTIAAAIAKQYNRGYTLQESRMFVRQACDDYSDGWDKETGYGTYVSGDPIPKEGLDPHDPFAIQITNEGGGYFLVDMNANVVSDWVGMKIDADSETFADFSSGPVRYYKPEDHILTVYSYDSEGNKSVGANYELSPTNPDVIDRNHINFGNLTATYDKNIPSGIDIDIELKKRDETEWNTWNDKELPSGYHKMRMKSYTDRTVGEMFESETFDVTNPD